METVETITIDICSDCGRLTHHVAEPMLTPAQEAAISVRVKRDATIYSMVRLSGKSPLEAADEFNLTVEDVRCIVASMDG